LKGDLLAFGKKCQINNFLPLAAKNVLLIDYAAGAKMAINV
jgi:hypothetical protein